jgi:epoxyqueuosine reductase
LFLAAILARVDLPPDPPVSRLHQERPIGTLCGDCTACLDACPTGALPAPGVLDARRCISYLTIEHKGVIPVTWRAAIGDRIYGCDICAEVCPWNRFAQQAQSVLLEARPHLLDLSLRDILQLTPERFAEVFRGTAIKRLKLRGLLRNACVVAANTEARECLPQLRALAQEPTEALVRAHAVWALRVLGAEEGLDTLCAAEKEPEVLAEYARELD